MKKALIDLILDYTSLVSPLWLSTVYIEAYYLLCNKKVHYVSSFPDYYYMYIFDTE